MRVLQSVMGGFSTVGLDKIVYRWGEAIYDDGIIFDYFCKNYYEESECVQNIRNKGGIVSYPDKRSRGLSKRIEDYKRIRMLNERNHYDVIHIHSPRAYVLLSSAIMARLAGIRKIIMHSHSSSIDGNLSRSAQSRRTFRIILHYLAKPLLPLIGDYFCACSDKAADWMFCGRARKEARIIDNAFSIKSFQFDETQRRQMRKAKNLDDSIVVGHVGRFTYQKNHQFILAIAEASKKRKLNLRFELIGYGDSIDVIKKEAQEKGLNNIDFVGKSDEVCLWMQAFDVFILPSRFEGLPVVGIEAQFAGLPCIFSDQIDQKVKISDAVVFLPIRKTNVNQWCDNIIKLAQIDRKKNSTSICYETCNIKHTVQMLKKLYNG